MSGFHGPLQVLGSDGHGDDRLPVIAVHLPLAGSRAGIGLELELDGVLAVLLQVVVLLNSGRLLFGLEQHFDGLLDGVFAGANVLLGVGVVGHDALELLTVVLRDGEVLQFLSVGSRTYFPE